ncbi:MAG: hypothetical protein UV80_C0002G0092 [Candidatus Peregrinibacteria bacterium GW2011_GWF2_43_17]|nr:MAG: hypothetical protein UV80_C0002G0092 [Candidatus Peregrinibacteria bacterium GW2011_GWF2_43_17]KKT18848.1 MAG: hypothetical protein UW03_C0029G0010 [Candidatus Peregrinibacteria bacterium GW2011_GWA2_43_8]HAU39863.1 hypothetical protein [Candidatus Peregrinibacteria bacterium]
MFTPLKNSAPQKVNLLSLGTEFGVMIAVPILIFGGIGFYLDGKFGTEPLFILIGVGLSILASSLLLYKRIREIFLELGIM